MRIRTDGLIMVEKTIEDHRIEHHVSGLTDVAAYGNGELFDATQMILQWVRTGQPIDRNRWPLEIPPPFRQSQEQWIALAAALLIREIDRRREITT